MTEWEINGDRGQYIRSIVEVNTRKMMDALNAEFNKQGDKITHIVDTLEYGGNHCVCGHPLRFEFIVENKEGVRVVGSTCITKHTTYTPEQANGILEEFKLLYKEILSIGPTMKNYSSFKDWEKSHKYRNQIASKLAIKIKPYLPKDVQERMEGYLNVNLPLTDEFLRQAFKTLRDTYISELKDLTKADKLDIRIKAQANKKAKDLAQKEMSTQVETKTRKFIQAAKGLIECKF